MKPLVTIYLDLREGIYYIRHATLAEKHRFLSGIFNHYNLHLSDYAIFNRGTSMMVLVLPYIAPQLRWELQLDCYSKFKHYGLVACCNIILERATESVRRELCWAEADIKLPFLKQFGIPIRLISKYIIRHYN